LLVDGTERRLRAKSFALLQFMVANSGRLLDRDEIMRAVWPDVISGKSVEQIHHGEAATLLSSAPSLPDKPSIAVLPFQNMSGDPDQEYFADGTVEEITTALSRIRWLFVIAQNSAF
jgi:hypothetical protein